MSDFSDNAHRFSICLQVGVLQTRDSAGTIRLLKSISNWLAWTLAVCHGENRHSSGCVIGTLSWGNWSLTEVWETYLPTTHHWGFMSVFGAVHQYEDVGHCWNCNSGVLLTPNHIFKEGRAITSNMAIWMCAAMGRTGMSKVSDLPGIPVVNIGSYGLGIPHLYPFIKLRNPDMEPPK